MSIRADHPQPDESLDEAGAAPDDELVLPWWQSRLNIVLLFVGVLLLAGGAGFVIGERNATPDPNATDIGFLQDMRTHHEQAVGISLTYMGRPGINGILATIAQEIAVGQSVDSGRMIQLLRDYGKPEANQTGLAMGWMGHEVPEDRMPGLASPADLDKLANATGEAADALFVQLMVVHHQGGIEMAQYAADHAATSEVREFAANMVPTQREEIAEIQNILNS